MNMRKIISAILLSSLILDTQFVSAQSKKNPPASLANTDARPNLVPLLQNPMTDEIRVRNIGAGPAAPSKLTLDCEKVEANPELRACPDLPPSFADTYFDPQFPKHATIKVPALAPGATYTHKLSFWNQMNWQKGKYKFTAVVRTSYSAQEIITKNKVAFSILPVP